MLVYINNTWQQHHHDSTHVTVNVGDSLTVVFRGVGNISLNATNMINATDPQFLCETNFACNMQLGLSDVSNRGMQCSLRTPAKLSDNGRILTVILDEMDQLNITITGKCNMLRVITIQVQWAGFFLPCNLYQRSHTVCDYFVCIVCTVKEKPLLATSLPPSVIPIATPSTERYPQHTSTGATAILPTSTNIEPTDTISSFVLLSSVVGTSNTGLPGQGITTNPPPSDKGMFLF